MGAKTPPHPAMAPLPPPSAHPPILGKSSTDAQLKSQRIRAGQQLYNAGGTIETSPQGLTQRANTAKATLLGQ